MYDESGYFDPTHDPNTMGGSLLVDGPPAETNCSRSGNNNNSSSSSLDDKLKLHAPFSLDELSNQHITASSMGLDHLHHQLGFDLEQDFHGHLMQEAAAVVDNWNPNLQDIQEGATRNHPDLHLPQYGAAAAAAPDLLNLLHLPSCTVAAPVLPPAPTFAFSSPGQRSGNFPVDIFGGELHGSDGGLAAHYDSSVQLGYPAPPAHHLLRDLLHTLPQNYGLFYGVDEREAAADVGGGMVGGGVGLFGEGEGGRFEDAVFEFRSHGRVEGKENYTTTEKQRREQLGEKYKLLKSLVPNPTKNDRASTISDAIDYINELKRTIEELTILVDTKKYGRNKKRKVGDNAAADVESSSMRSLRDGVDSDHPFSTNGSLRSSWIQRRTKETSLDVRIVDDEVTVKVTRRKKANWLLSASKAIEELHLDLVHVSGGHIGDCYVFMFNTKISVGSYVYAGAVAKKLLEAMDVPCPTLPIRF